MGKYLLTLLLLLPYRSFAANNTGLGDNSVMPPEIIITDPGSFTLIRILSYGEEILIKVVLPLVIIGVSLYVAYELLTAEGDEAKMKKAWKTVSYSAIGLITVGLAYVIISIISNISF